MKSIASMRIFISVLLITLISGSANIVTAAPADIDKILTQVAVYDYGASREPLTQLRELVRDNLDSKATIRQFEQKMINVLKSDATFAGKQFICKQLSIIGSSASVPVLAKMLRNDETTDIALYALERIPDPSVDKALRKAVGKAKGNAKIGIINTIGQRADAGAIKILVKLMNNKNADIADASAAALGKIATPEATAALSKQIDKSNGIPRLVLLDAYLKCADKLATTGKIAEASAIYGRMYNTAYPDAVRAAGFRGLIMTAGDKAVSLIQSALAADDTFVRSVAISLIRELPKDQSIQPLLTGWEQLSDLNKIQLLTALADRGDVSARSTIRSATSDPSMGVRVAALKALAVLGTKADITLLAQRAAAASGDEKAAAQNSLALIRGDEVDATILATIPVAIAAEKAVLIRSLEERNTKNAVELLLSTATDADRKVRLESWRSLGTLAHPDNVPAMIDLLIHARADERNRAEQAVLITSKRGDSKAATNLILTKLKKVKAPEAQGSLIRVLGKLEQPDALSQLRKALRNRNDVVREAAIAALSDWPTTEPMNDLLKLVKSTKNDVHRILALRGFINLIGRDTGRPPAETITLYQQAMQLATETNEKRMVLSGLAHVGSVAAFDAVKPYLKDPALKSEAEVAMLKIAESSLQKTVDRVRSELEAVIKTTENNQVRRDGSRLLEKISK